MLRSTLLTATAAIGLSFGAAAPANATIFSFAGLTEGSTTPLSITQDGVTAAFSSPGDSTGGSFVVGNGGFFPTLTGNLLDSAGFAGELDISFSTPVSAVEFAFGKEVLFGTPDPLILTANGVSQTFTPVGAAFPAAPAGYAIFTSATPFTSLAITGGANDGFAIGDVQTPEPVSIALLGVGLAGLGVARRRR